MESFSDQQLQRYARNILLPEIGATGQTQLAAARVLIVGAGGLGAPVIAYLVAAGVGTAPDKGCIGVIDDDVIALTNLQRQIIYRESDIGAAKVCHAERFATSLNAESQLVTYEARLTAESARSLVAGYDLVVDGSDNFETRYVLNAACVQAKKPLVSAALLRFDGQLSVFRGYLPSSPCYRCLFPEPPKEGVVPSCSAAGVLGSVAGTLATLQATEVIKTLLEIGNVLDGILLIYSGLDAEFRRIKIPKMAECPCCGA